MRQDLYFQFYNVQKKHWWFVVKKEIVIDTIYRFLPQDKKMKILDIGCGSGLMLNALENHGEVFGMDMSDDAINFSKQIFNGQVEKGCLPHTIPYPNDYFDLIVALDVIEHVTDDEASLVTMCSRMKVGAKAIITVPACMLLWSDHDVVNEHKRRYNFDELKTKLIASGFVIEKISYFNSLLFPVALLVRTLNNIFNRGGESDINVPPFPINQLLKIIFRSEKFILRYFNIRFPGVSLIAVVRKVR